MKIARVDAAISFSSPKFLFSIWISLAGLIHHPKIKNHLFPNNVQVLDEMDEARKVCFDG
ncbi:hypothetical protein V6Z12_A08G158400 [Gossypium hirsutum]